MQNVGFVRRSSDQLHHKKIIFHLTGASHHNHQKSKYWKTHQNHKTWNISSWNDGAHKTASASKKTKRYTPEQKLYMEIGKNMVHQNGAVKQTHKNMDHTGSKEEPQSIKFEKPKCSSCKQNEIRSHRKIIFLHTGAAQHHIHEKSKYSITHHIHKTWNKSE